MTDREKHESIIAHYKQVIPSLKRMLKQAKALGLHENASQLSRDIKILLTGLSERESQLAECTD